MVGMNQQQWVKRSWSYDEEGHLQLKEIEAIEIPACDECAQRAIDGNAFFTYCVADGHWGATGHVCRGGCERRLYGQILEPEAV
jgi:hypothetical protein